MLRSLFKQITFSLKNPLIKVCQGCVFIKDERIQFNGKAYIGPNALWDASGHIIIGDNVIIGPKSIIWSSSHNYRSNTSIPYGPHNEDIKKEVKIGDNVWIGVNVTILMGVTIGEGAVIGASSVITKDVEPMAIYGGNPARKLGMREEEQYRKLLNSKYLYEK